MSVYFVQAGQNGPIKIGYADDVGLRLNKIRSDCPQPITLLLEIEGGLDVEAALHERFDALRFRGEWFWPGKALLTFIETMTPEPVEEEPQPLEPDYASPRALIESLGGTSAVARLLGAPVTTVHAWVRKDSIPDWRMMALDALIAERT
jgi:hypothetical protein